MSLAALGVLAAMGALAGMINAAVGSGSLLTMPVLLALGLPPGTAVRTNTIGMMFATMGSVAGNRREIARERRRGIGPLLAVTLMCSAAGSVLLLVMPDGALAFVVPTLILVALVLVVLQTHIARAIDAHRERRHDAGGAEHEVYRSPALLASMGAAAGYGGFFTAAQGILYLGILGAFTGRPMTDVNAMKNLLALVVNLTAAAVYLTAHALLGAEICWQGVLAIASGSLIGGYAGSHVAKRLPEGVMRGLIVVVALVALVRQVL